MIELIADRNRFKALRRLFDFLATWEERPRTLTPMAYEWCSAISEAAGQAELAGTRTSREIRAPFPLRAGFSQIGPNIGPSHSDNAFHIRGRLQGSTSGEYLDLHTPLKIAFRLFGSPNDRLPTVELNHTSHHDRVFEVAFSSEDDEVIADAACAWVVGYPSPTGSCARYFAERVGNPRPFSRRLRAVAIHAIGGRTQRPAPGLEVIRSLNRLDACVGDLQYVHSWCWLLMDVIRSPVGANLSSHYWRLLGELQSKGNAFWFGMRDVEVMRSLEEAEDWEKLEVWIAVLWASRASVELTPELVEVVGDATLRLILLRPSALQRFENLPKRVWADSARAGLVEVLDQARVGRLALEAQHPPYVSVHPSPSGSLFLPYPSFLPANWFPPSHLFPFFLLETTLSQIMLRVDVQIVIAKCTRVFFNT